MVEEKEKMLYKFLISDYETTFIDLESLIK